MGGRQPDEDGVLGERIEQVRHKIRGVEQATKFLADKGAKNNEQILVHDIRLVEHDRRLDNLEHALDAERRERESEDAALRGADSKALWLLVSFAFTIAAASVSFALGVIPT